MFVAVAFQGGHLEHCNSIFDWVKRIVFVIVECGLFPILLLLEFMLFFITGFSTGIFDVGALLWSGFQLRLGGIIYFDGLLKICIFYVVLTVVGSIEK
jgi:hypothetical protein